MIENSIIFKTKISKDELNDLPIQAFRGKIYLVDNIDDTYTALDILKNKKILGFDTETRPVFVKGRFNHVALLQLSTENQAFLFRLQNKEILEVISEILSDKNIIKAGVAIRDDIKGLKKIHDFEPMGFIELQTYVNNFGIKDAGLRKLAGNILGFRISKTERISNWEKTKLTNSQIKYAATDAWVGYKIYKKLSKLNKSKN